MAIRNFDASIKNPTGEVIVDNGKETPMRINIVNILGQDPMATAKTGEEKIKRGNLAMKVLVGGDINFTTEELATIKQVVGEADPPFIVKQIWDAVEADPRKPEAEVLPKEE